MSKYVSIELAKQLKEAGLEHEWQLFDYYAGTYKDIEPWEVMVIHDEDDFAWIKAAPTDTYDWLPNLHDLLDWLEKRGWSFELSSPLLCL